MLGLRHLPLKYRLPLIHGSLNLLGRWRVRKWPRMAAEGRLLTDGLRSGDFVVSGFLNESSGIAQGGRLSAAALSEAGYDVLRHDLRPCFKNILGAKAELPGSGGVWFIHANAPECLVALMAHDPADWGSRYRIGYWAWETPKAPASWVLAAGFLHEIWVPSTFVRDAFAATFNAALRADLIERLKVMPHPVPVPSPGRRAAARQKFALSQDQCEVLCLFDTKSSAARKNPWGVLEAWRRAFPQTAPHARLTLKVSDLSDDRATEQHLLSLTNSRDDIRLMRDRLSDRDMALFTGAFDVLISLHRSEGFGLSLAEAMAAHVAVIATGWSGNTDFMTAENSSLVAASLIPVHDPEGNYAGLENDPAQVWAEPELWVATRALRELTASKAARDALTGPAVAAVRALSEPWKIPALLGQPFNKWL